MPSGSAAPVSQRGSIGSARATAVLTAPAVMSEADAPEGQCGSLKVWKNGSSTAVGSFTVSRTFSGRIILMHEQERVSFEASGRAARVCHRSADTRFSGAVRWFEDAIGHPAGWKRLPPAVLASTSHLTPGERRGTLVTLKLGPDACEANLRDCVAARLAGFKTLKSELRCLLAEPAPIA